MKFYGYQTKHFFAVDHIAKRRETLLREIQKQNKCTFVIARVLEDIHEFFALYAKYFNAIVIKL